MESQNNYLLLLLFLKTAEEHKYVVRKSCYQKNIGAQFTHLNIPSLSKECFVIAQ